MELEHPFGELIGLDFDDMSAGTSCCRIEVKGKLFNPFGALHGGVLYSMADTGMGGALFPLLKEGEYCATVEIKITYFKAVRGGSLECQTKVINRGKTIASLESEISNDGELVAKAYGSFSIFKP